MYLGNLCDHVLDWLLESGLSDFHCLRLLWFGLRAIQEDSLDRNRRGIMLGHFWIRLSDEHRVAQIDLLWLEHRDWDTHGPHDLEVVQLRHHVRLVDGLVNEINSLELVFLLWREHCVSVEFGVINGKLSRSDIRYYICLISV